MDGSVFVGVDGTTLVNGLTNDIDNSAEGFGTNGHKNGGTAVRDGLATDEALGRVESDGSHVVATKMLGDFKDESVFNSINLKGVKNWGQLALELHVDDGTNDLGNLTLANSCTEAAYTRESVMIS